MIASGKLRHRVLVQKPTNRRTASGAVADEWETHCERWSDVRAAQGSERLAADQLVSVTPFAVTLRFDAETRQITPKMRIVYAGRVLDIESVLTVDELKREIVLGCSDKGILA